VESGFDVKRSGIFKELEKKSLYTRSCEVLFNLFLRAYPEMKLNWKDNRKNWTKKILTFFGELGNVYNYFVCLNKEYGFLDIRNEPTGEYLVDLCWYYSNEEETAYWIELALESELSSKDVDSIKYDFWKLTDVKAYTKIGIFMPSLRDRQRVMEEISYLVAYHGIRVPTERYLVILILNHGVVENEARRIEIVGYEINYFGDVREVGSKRFPEKLRATGKTKQTSSK